MFRRFKDSVSNAVSAAADAVTGSEQQTAENSTRVSELAAMGFREAEARHALRVNNGNMEAAAEWLLTNGHPVGVDGGGTGRAQTTGQQDNNNTGTRNNPINIADDDNDDVQRAIQASLNHQQPSTTTATKQKPVRSAASKNAGLAAAARRLNNGSAPNSGNSNSSGGSSNNSNKKKNGGKAPIASHPQVQVPKRLSQHDKEDVILRLSARLAPSPNAVDTLLRSLKTIQSDPSNQKYQVVDTTTPGFQRSLTATGVLDFFKAMNFHPDPSNPKILRLAFLDAATFYLGISALEQVQLTSKTYAYNKTMLQFDNEISNQLGLADLDTNEAIKRSTYMSKCPSEPLSAGGSQVTVELGSTTKISRKFDGDDTLGDVINWLGGHASIIPGKLLMPSSNEGGGWYLIDRNHAHEHPYNVLELTDKTLQYVGCWPSGRLAVVPMLKNEGDDVALRIPSSRGLAAGPADHLKI
mmetsp:Transcript_24663/g.58544  ORF Transcript_24663/g.58544 Transcript_24663/m.58544 type:complete len:468 (-) Transcript_24663:429-1832(-)